jgi:hypothetical protein
MNRRTIFLSYSFLFVVALATVWQLLSLGNVPETPANDLAKHVAEIENFRLAFLDGQWIPRLQLAPANFPDIPVFQFYGFMMGLLSLPFLEMGLLPMHALVLGVLVVRWLGAAAIFRTGLMLGSSLWASLLASVSYLLTPYLISNLYGRVAVPEATAHGVLGILLYGLVRLGIRGDGISVLVLCLSVVAIALSHPIFLLYGCIASAVFMLLTLKPRMILLGAVVLGASLLVAGFQWYPAFLVRNDLAINFLSQSPYNLAKLTSYSGLYGFPVSLTDRKLSNQTMLFLTPGILTLPVLILLVRKIGNLYGRATLCCATFFLLLSFPPVDFWKLTPQFLWALQFPYRLLAFVALFIALGICLTFEQLKAQQFFILAGVLLVQSFGVLVQQPYSAPLSGGQREIAERFASLDYLITPTLPLTHVDGWMQHYAVSLISNDWTRDQMIDGKGYLLEENVLSPDSPRTGENYLRITGVIEGSNLSVQLWIADTAKPQVPLDGLRTVNLGQFSTFFKLPDNNPGNLTLRSSFEPQTRPVPYPMGRPLIKLDAVDRLPGHRIQVRSSSSRAPRVISIIGWTVFTDGPVELWLARVTAPDVAVSERVAVGPGPFSIRLRLPNETGDYILVPSRYLIPALADAGSSDHRRLSVFIKSYRETSAEEGAVEDELLIPAALVDRTFSHGYRREFRLKAASVAEPIELKSASALVELPIAYSPLVEITQAGTTLLLQASNTGLALARTTDLKSPFLARFRLPWIVWLGMAAGFCVVIVSALALSSTIARTGLFERKAN